MKLAITAIAALTTLTALWVVNGTNVAAAQDKMSKMMPGKMMPGKMMSKTMRVKMMVTPLAAKAGLQNAMGHADVNIARGTATLSVTLPEGAALPQNTVLEGWLSTAGLATASQNDQKYGPAFGKEDVAMKSRAIPYALSTGLLRRVGSTRTYVGSFKIDNPLTPYGAVAVTLESDGNKGMYDPRPGTPLMAGMLQANLMSAAKMDKMSKMDKPM